MSHKWNHTICNVLRPVSFTQYNGFETHPRLCILIVNSLSLCDALNCVLPKYMLKSYPPVPPNVTLFGSRMIIDIITQDEVMVE